ncbi:MAG: sn-glycerol-3-phosphate ABC transporter ATP-binding protein UgpC [Brevinematales bacterium]|nr:sn-glycerol-3-phosphate ABC transporter ATP-binding protein UgpC [Brevinematales bacterium]
MAKVILKHVSKVYDNGYRAVDDFNLEIGDGEFVVIVGPSGCGKTTTLRMIAGLEDISEGELWIDNVLVNNIPPKDRDIAMVFQNYALYPHMTVYKNMAFGLKLRKVPQEEIDKRVKEAAEILGLQALLDRKPKQLSGGQRQRVALGRAIVRKPKVFLFDEPLSNLDAKLRVQMRAEISKLHARLGVTTVYVTHDQVEAMTLGTRIVVMKDGKIQQVGTPLEVYSSPNNKFVAGFIGSPPMNFMEVTVEQSGDNYYIDEGSFRILLPKGKYKSIGDYVGRKVIMGIRPEFIYDRGSYTGSVNENVISANVEITEILGAEQYVYFATEKHPFIARFDPFIHVKLGERREVVVDLEKLILFDSETEYVLN